MYKRCTTVVEGGHGGPHEPITGDVEFSDIFNIPRVHDGELIRIRRGDRTTWVPIARVISIEEVPSV
ncbi:hypothetical protein SEA_NYCEIRAE_2 [Gordonia phage Nyceirae]|uniref:Uncharacterized protein n=1 Tax=Gordonia phage Nyceirae TaxID=1887651 RepID=A0A1C9EHZ2_9CAUD|nr:hypothetical protein BIZ68_gp02 [Gordonia phage Nyceirae]AON97365.1 hypothetical protein SEA_NYCEIRAE_2 [Gordonia phage Nyceirae]